MRKISEIIIHCSDSPKSLDIGAAEIDKWHKDKGWSGIGYHYVIKRNGDIESGRPIHEVGAHCKGRNEHSIGVCVIGGNNGQFDYNPDQFESLADLVQACDLLFPGIKVSGHNDYSDKDCPCFDVKEWFW